MKNKRITLLLIVFLNMAIPSISQTQPSAWEKLNALTGDWVAEGGGQPGQGGGSFSFEYNLSNKILVRKNLSEYPASGNKPAVVHEDLMVIYAGNSGELLKAIYFDNEGHTINYSISFSDSNKIIQFVSNAQLNTPRFRLTYIFSDKDNMTVDFEIATNGSSENFKSYVKGTAHKKK